MDNAQRLQVHQWIKETLDLLGESQLKDTLKVEFSNRFNKRLGDASRSSSTGDIRVRFSVKWWAIIDDAQRRNTVIHEVCHIVDMTRGGSRVNGPHGKSWQALMIQCGERPERCAPVKRPPEMRNKVQRHPLKCLCERQLMITSHRRTKMLKNINRGIRYTCRVCDAVFQLN